MKFLIRIRQNLTACDTIFRGRSTTRTLQELLFDTREEAEKSYESQKASFRFAGLAGQYVTFPEEVADDYQVPKYFCEHCGEGFSNETYAELDGDFCSKVCFRNNFQDNNNDLEEQYEDDY